MDCGVKKLSYVDHFTYMSVLIRCLILCHALHNVKWAVSPLICAPNDFKHFAGAKSHRLPKMLKFLQNCKKLYSFAFNSSNLQSKGRAHLRDFKNINFVWNYFKLAHILHLERGQLVFQTHLILPPVRRALAIQQNTHVSRLVIDSSKHL